MVFKDLFEMPFLFGYLALVHQNQFGNIQKYRGIKQETKETNKTEIQCNI